MWTKIKAFVKAWWETIAINGRDIFSTLLLIVAILFSVEAAAIVADKFGFNIDSTKDFIFAIGKFAAVCLCGVGYLAHVTFRGSLGAFDREGFMAAWEAFEPAKKLEWFFKLVIAGIIAAALVFSIGV